MNSKETAQDYIDFLNASPSPMHACKTLTEKLSAHGFDAVDERGAWPSEAGAYYMQRGAGVIAWIIPELLSDNAGFSIFGCHTDSPTFKLKPTPQSTSADKWGQLSVEIYGGMLYNSWLDRELILAGALYDHAGKMHLVQTPAVARIPQLAIHLDREVNKGLKLDPQQHLQPVWTVDNPDAQIMQLLAKEAGLADASEISSFDVVCATAQGAQLFGDKEQFLASGRQDNLSSVFAGLQGLLDAKAAKGTANADQVSVLAAFDNEEVGSASRSGAAGSLLEDVLRRISASLGKDTEGTLRMFANSNCLSADAGHSVHPNYASVHDPETRPVMGRGPLLKINANQRYASDGPSEAWWNRVCSAAQVPSQSFVSNNAMPCGSTIGPITATRLGISTVDAGIGLLSMHSAREMSHVDDIAMMAKVAQAYFEGHSRN